MKYTAFKKLYVVMLVGGFSLASFVPLFAQVQTKSKLKPKDDTKVVIESPNSKKSTTDLKVSQPKAAANPQDPALNRDRLPSIRQFPTEQDQVDAMKWLENAKMGDGGSSVVDQMFRMYYGVSEPIDDSDLRFNVIVGPSVRLGFSFN